MVCHACTETKVLNSLINYESKSNLMKWQKKKSRKKTGDKAKKQKDTQQNK